MLRLPQVLHNQPHGLRRVELGEAALVTFFLLFLILHRTLTDFTRTSFSCPPQSVPVRCCCSLPRTLTDFTRTSFFLVRFSPCQSVAVVPCPGHSRTHIFVRFSPCQSAAFFCLGRSRTSPGLLFPVRVSPLLICRIDTFDGLFSEKCCAYIRAQVREGFSEYCVNCVKCVNGTASSGFASQALIRLRALTSSAL